MSKSANWCLQLYSIRIMGLLCTEIIRGNDATVKDGLSVSAGKMMSVLGDVLFMAALRSNGQAIIFYSCVIYYLLFFRSAIFEAEERRPARPLPECRNAV